MYFRRISLTVFLFFISVLLLHAGKGRISPSDSIRRLLPHLSGQQRLDALSNLGELALNQDDSIYELRCWNEYITEARRQKSFKDEAFARKSKMVCYYNYDMCNELQASLPSELEFFAKHKLWNNYYSTWCLSVDMYVYLNKFQTALREVKKIYTDARERGNRYGLGIASYGMGTVYQHLQNTDESSKSYEKAILFLSKEEDATDLLYAYEGYSEVLNGLGDYKRLKSITADWKNVIDRYKSKYEKEGNDISSLNSVYRYCYLVMSTAAMETGHLDSAGQLLQEAEKLTEGGPPIVRVTLLREKGRYYELKKEYDKALACNDERIRLDLSMKNNLGLLDARQQRARILMSAGRMVEAALLYQKILPERDSLLTAQTAGQINELSTLYKVDELTLENKLSADRLYAAIVCIVLLSVSIVIYFIYTHRLRRKNRVLYDTIVQSQKMQDDLYISHEQISEDQLSNEEILYRKLCKLIQAEELFKDSQIKREDLAAKLGTNRTYLADAIKQCTGGLTFMEYLNRCRLRHTATLLAEDQDRPINEIGDLSGFNSRSTFNRLFRDFYGMSLSEYRAISKEKKIK